MLTQTAETFRLENFEGPLDLLWHLINRHELDIYEIAIKEITEQYLARAKEAATLEIDQGAEFISIAASLLWYKSKTLLPKHEQQIDQTIEEEIDPHFNIIHHLLDYCRFKHAAKELSEREMQQGAFYPRGIEGWDVKKPLGIEHLTLDDLSVLFQEILAKAEPRRGTIHEEEWKVSDKIAHLKFRLLKEHKILFTEAFNPSMSRDELIVTFLALLEMMKSGDAKVILEQKSKTISIIGTANG